MLNHTRFAIIATAAAAFLALAATCRAQDTAPQTAQPDLGACVWAHVPESDKSAFAAVYHKATLDGLQTHMGEVAQYLQSQETQLDQAVTACVPAQGVPPLWRQAMVISQALQSGASAELLASRHIGRPELDDAWAQAPDDARQCTLANAAKSLGVSGETCPDSRATFWFLTHLGIDKNHPSDRADALQILLYFSAKAQGLYATRLITQSEQKK
ncbi:MAG: hypothetical protein ACXU8U_08920 [Asticcacaulis sp.]